MQLVILDQSGEPLLNELLEEPGLQYCFTLEGLEGVEELQFRLVSIDGGSFLIDNPTPHSTCTQGVQVANVRSTQDYYPFGMVMPGRQFNSGSYRYGFGSHEMDNEVSGTGNHLSFGDYGYNSRLGRRWNVDPQDHQMPGISPYSYALGNPIMLKDPDGELPIIPFLLKASAAAGADVLLQASMIYLTDDNVESFGDALTKVDKTDVALSFVEGLNPFKVPGGKFGEAALVGFADVLVGIGERAVDGEENTGEAIGQDFLIGFASQLTGDQFSKLLTSKRAKQKLKALLGDKFNVLLKSSIDIDGVVKSSARMDRNGLTRAGRALQKHAGREGGAFSNINFSHKTGNNDANNLVKDILSSKDQLIEDAENGGKIIYDKSTGRGVGISRSGEFNGFRELEK